MRLALLAALLTACLAGVTAGRVAAATGCGSGAHGKAGYAYAGFQSDRAAHGVRARISATAAPSVAAGHVAGWIGVGGRGAGAGGRDQWLQAGLASLPGTPTLVYVEIVRGSGAPTFVPYETEVAVGAARSLAVLEVKGQRDRWQVWLDGKPIGKPAHLPGSSGRWRPMATAESWNGGSSVCNRFAFRFEEVSVAQAAGGSWRAFVPGTRFQDVGFGLRTLRAAGLRAPASGRGPQPYAFLATST